MKIPRISKWKSGGLIFKTIGNCLKIVQRALNSFMMLRYSGADAVTDRFFTA